MRKPNTLQLRLLVAAHRNGGRLPSHSFAYYGVYAPYGGTEKIQAALAAAAKTRSDADAAQILLDRLDRGQMLMAGGFLGVERSDHDGSGTLAEQYVAAIRAGRIEFGLKADKKTIHYVQPATLHACIRAGWLDEKWRITEAGYAAGRAAEPREFRPLYDIEWRETCYRRAVQTNSAAPHMGDAADQLIAEAHDEALEEDADRTAQNATADPAGLVRVWVENHAAHDPDAVRAVNALDQWVEQRHAAGKFLVEGQTGKGKTRVLTAAEILRRTNQARVAVLDRSSRVAAGMGGYDYNRLTEETRQAQQRGIAPSLFRRLLPAVTGDLVDELLPRITVIRDELARMLIEAGRQDAAHKVDGDPRETGYRVALVEVRQTAGMPEQVRKTAFRLEIALSACRAGKRDTAQRCLARAADSLARRGTGGR